MVIHKDNKLIYSMFSYKVKIKHNKYMDFVIRQLAEKQSPQAFQKAHDSLLLWHPSCSWETFYNQNLNVSNSTPLGNMSLLKTGKRPRRVSDSDSHSNVCGYIAYKSTATPEQVEFRLCYKVHFSKNSYMTSLNILFLLCSNSQVICN